MGGRGRQPRDARRRGCRAGWGGLGGVGGGGGGGGGAGVGAGELARPAQGGTLAACASLPGDIGKQGREGLRPPNAERGYTDGLAGETAARKWLLTSSRPRPVDPGRPRRGCRCRSPAAARQGGDEDGLAGGLEAGRLHRWGWRWRVSEHQRYRIQVDCRRRVGVTGIQDKAARVSRTNREQHPPAH